MTDDDAVTRLQRIWERAQDQRHTLSRAFYRHLFEMNPEARSLFTTDMGLQYTKFGMSLDFLISSLRDWERLAPGAADLGLRHVTYGVERAHYDAAGEALIRAFQEVLGPAFGAEETEAVQRCYRMVKDAMSGFDTPHVA